MPRSYPDRWYQRTAHSPKYGVTSDQETSDQNALFSTSEQKALARLAGKYGLNIITTAAKQVPVRGPGRPRRERLTDESLPKLKLSIPDAKHLARLVRKYGRATIAAAVMEVPLPVRGRPSRGLDLVHERMWLADLIEEWADEHRQAGTARGKAVTNAIFDLYEVRYGGGQAVHFTSFRKTVKKQLREGRYYWDEYARRVQSMPPHLTERFGLPEWVVRRLRMSRLK